MVKYFCPLAFGEICVVQVSDDSSSFGEIRCPKFMGNCFSTLCCEESCNYSFQKDFDQRFSLQFLHHLANDGNDDEHDNLGYYRGDKNDKDLLSRGREA